jgi:Xaa-Pro aminopeptidase
MELEKIQEALREQGLDAWLFYDHHGRDPIAYRVLGLPASAHVTRRWYYVIPADGEPVGLVHRIEAGRLDCLPGAKTRYSSWQEHEAGLRSLLAPYQRVAMQYSPRNTIMYVSMVDAGTVELLRGMGKEIVSSADLVSRFEAVLSERQIASHYEAQRAIDAVLPAGFAELRRRLDAGVRTTEYDMVLWLGEAMRREGLVWENGPNVSVNENSSDSHYEATADRSRVIRDGDFLLVDIWGQKDPAAAAFATCFYDITWTGVLGREPSAREALVFETVRNARDAAIALVEKSFAAGEAIAGWEADDAARRVILDAGFGEFFTHRTGHNIAATLHGTGAHLDNLETHDERLLLAGTCFSVEPGVYLPEFGVRSEVNMMTSPGKAVVTGRVQQELLKI